MPFGARKLPPSFWWFIRFVGASDTNTAMRYIHRQAVTKHRMHFLSWQGVNIKVEHIFSVELDDRKRNLLQKMGGMRHLFKSVRVFEEKKGFCDISQSEVEINEQTCGIDLLVAGPACTNLSLLNRQRKDYAGSYEQNEESGDIAGVSAETYIFGFKRVSKPNHLAMDWNLECVCLIFPFSGHAVWRHMVLFLPEVVQLLMPPLAIYENVRGATQRVKDGKGQWSKPCVEEGGLNPPPAFTASYEIRLIELLQDAWRGYTEAFYVPCQDSRNTHVFGWFWYQDLECAGRGRTFCRDGLSLCQGLGSTTTNTLWSTGIRNQQNGLIWARLNWY